MRYDKYALWPYALWEGLLYSNCSMAPRYHSEAYYLYWSHYNMICCKILAPLNCLSSHGIWKLLLALPNSCLSALVTPNRPTVVIWRISPCISLQTPHGMRSGQIHSTMASDSSIDDILKTVGQSVTPFGAPVTFYSPKWIRFRILSVGRVSSFFDRFLLSHEHQSVISLVLASHRWSTVYSVSTMR